MEKQGILYKISNGNIWDKDNFSRLLEDSKSLGPVETVFYVIDNYEESWRKNIESLALEAKKTCPIIKYFIVIDTKNLNIGEEIKIIKMQEKSFTWIKIPNIKMAATLHYNLKFSTIDLTNVIEKTLCSKGSMILSHIKAERESILQELAEGPVITSDQVSKDTTLLNFSTKKSKLMTLGAKLQNSYNTFMTEADLQSLTIKSILSFEKMASKDFSDVNGLQVFCSYVDSDEMEATSDFIFLSTLAFNAATSCEEFREPGYIYLVPGVEGHYSRFIALCKSLKLPAVALQPGIDNPQETLREMAARYVKILLEKAELKDKFYLISYESGVLVALEMALILETKGLSGVIFCIGGSPDVVKNQFVDILQDYDTEEKLQNAVIQHMHKLIINKKEDNINEIIKKSTWKEKLNALVQKTKNDSTLSCQYVYQLTEATFERLKQVLEYKNEPVPLKAKLVSLCPKSSTPGNIPLQKHSLQPVVEYNLPSSLASITQDLRCAAIINRHLDEDILKAFDKSNLCEAYFTSPFSFGKDT